MAQYRYGNCARCGAFGSMEAHRCLPFWEIWEKGEDPEEHRRVRAYDADDAAENWLKGAFEEGDSPALDFEYTVIAKDANGNLFEVVVSAERDIRYSTTTVGPVERGD